MRAFQDELGVTANNIANVNTTGYKPQKSSFGDLLYTQMDTRSADLLVGHGVRNTGVESTFVQGSFEQTGRELDFAISGKAYFAVEVNEECGHVLGEHLAVAALQRGAGHHGVFAERLTCHHPGVDDVQPRPAVLIGEWNAG